MIRIALVFLILSGSQISIVKAGSFLNPQIQGTIFYVRTGTNGDCTSWPNACDLVTALYRAEPGDQVWVAAGTYKPTTTTNREYTFNLESGVALYGGFPARGGDWHTRNWQQHLTILSGEIGNQNSRSDNSYHVVTAKNVDNTAILDGFKITHGYASFEHNEGGGLYISNSSPQLRNLLIFENFADVGGGAYFSKSDSVIENVSVYWNDAHDGGGGFRLGLTNLQIKNSTFYGNYSSSDGGAIFLEWYANADLDNTYFISNSSFWGGAICLDHESTVNITNSNFSENSGSYGGAMCSKLANINIVDSTFSENRADWYGGAFYINRTNFSIKRSTIDNNIAEKSDGGGVYFLSSYGGTEIESVDFILNYAHGNGGAICTNGYTYLPINNANIINNAAQYGGGIYIDSNGPFTLSNSLISANYAEFSGGGLNSFNSPVLTNVTITNNYAEYRGGGMYHRGGDYSRVFPSLTNVTFFKNNAEDGGGLYNNSESTNIINSIFWENLPNQITDETNTVTTTFSTVQYGMVGEGNISTNPELLELSDNGGPTETHALNTGSPAIDKGSPSVCPSTDQRGLARPYDGDGDGISRCDMGAYEWEKATLTININGNGSFNTNPSKPDYVAGEQVELTAISESGWIFAGWSGDVTDFKNPVDIIVFGDMVITVNFVEITDRLYFPAMFTK